MELVVDDIKIEKYQEYKNSGIPWLNNVPKHWSTKPLFTIATLVSITNCTDRELLSVYLDRGVIRFSDVEEKRTNVTSEDLSKYQAVEPGYFVLNNQQAWRGSVGVSKFRGIVSPAYLVLSLSEEVDSNFANYLFRDSTMVSHYLISSKGVGTIQRNLYWPQLKRANVCLPPKEEQTAIAQFLDRKTTQIDIAIAQKEKLIELLKERRQILIHKAVTRGLNPNVKLKPSGIEWIGEIPEHWGICALSYLAKVDTGSTPDRSRPSYWNGNIPWVKTGEVNYEVITDTEEHITQTGLKNSATRLAPEGTLLMAMYGQGVTRGRVGILGVPATYNQACCAIQFDYRINNLFGYNFFIAAYPHVRDAGNETSQMNLSSGYISKLKIPIPPKQEQTEIINYINEISRKISRAVSIKEQEIEKLKEYKATLINSAVTGKIKVC